MAGLTVRKKPNIRLQGTYSNDHATIHFRSLRTRARVAAVVTDADGRVLLAVRGNRRDVPQVTFAGIVVTDHGDFSPEEQATLHALRTSPEALALGEMLRAQPAREPDTRDPWAALHDLYKFLTHVGGPGPDGLYQWEERPAPEDQPSLSTTTASLMDVDPDGGGGGGGWGDPPPPPPSGGPYPGAAWNCAGDTDQCIGQSGPGCFGTYVMGTRVHKWNCAALRHDINNRQRDCTLNGSSTTGGCCGTLEDAITAVLTEPDIGREGLINCTLNPSVCPNPTSCCAMGGTAPNGCRLQGGVCREIWHCDPNGQPGSTQIWPCPGETAAGAKYIITRYSPDYQHGNLLRTDATLFTFPEPGRIVMGISCKATGYGILRVDPDAALCQVFGRCTLQDLMSLDEATLDHIYNYYRHDMPFFHKCGAHGFGWYETAWMQPGTWLVFGRSESYAWGFYEGHGTADTFAYVGNGGRYQATWAGNACY